MSEPFLAEVRIVGFNFPPRGWAQCDGQILPINQNQSLYSLLGTIYGGDGRTSFALPDLRGRIPMHEGTGFPLGQRSGQESVVLTEAQNPPHAHAQRSSSDPASAADPSNGVPAVPASSIPTYAVTGAGTMASTESTGGQAHDNMPPFQVVNFIIALQGLFPSRN